jgi:transposase
LKSAVTHPSYYEPDLNPTYRDLGEHYGVAIIPARPYRARDKAYVSYCTSSRLRKGESWLFGSSAALAL